MRNSKNLRIAAALALGLLLGACNNGSHHGNGFAPLVTNLIQNQTNETGAPIETNGQTFSFPTSDTAFDAVLPPDTGPVVN